MPLQLHPEEDLMFKFLVSNLKIEGYNQGCFGFKAPIEVQEGCKKKPINSDLVHMSVSLGDLVNG